MSHVYCESIMYKSADMSVINSCTFSANCHNSLFKEYDLIREDSRKKNIDGSENQQLTIVCTKLKHCGDYWVLIDNCAYRCVNSENDKYSNIYAYFSHYYMKYALARNKFKVNTQVHVSPLNSRDINENFVTVQGNIVFSYMFHDNESLTKYYDHNVIIKHLRTYLVEQSTVICHNQVFMLTYYDEETNSNHIIPMSILLRDKCCNDGSIEKQMIKESKYKKGFRFDTDLSKNVVFIAEDLTMNKDVYTHQERVKNMKITWTYENDGSGSCNFVEQSILANSILNQLNDCSFKIDQKGNIKKTSGTVSFCVKDINCDAEKKLKIYYLKEPTGVKYVNANVNHKNTVDFAEDTALSIMIVFSSDFSTDTTESKEDIASIKINLLYEPSPNGNVVFFDSLLEPIPAESMSINIKCLSEVRGNYILWKKTYNNVVSELLSRSGIFSNNNKLEKIIDGLKFEFTILDFTPRAHYIVDQNYGACPGICYKENFTKLTFNAKYKDNNVNVIVCENDGVDDVVELECVLGNNVKKVEIVTLDNLFEMISHMNQQPKAETKTNALLLDENRMCVDILKKDIVWENKQYNFIVPQHNISLSLTFRKIIWKKNKKINANANLSSTYIGTFDPSFAKIKWIHNEDIYIVPKNNGYHEKTKQDIINWTSLNKIGGLDDTIWDLYRHLIVLRNPQTIDVLKNNGLKPSKGVILYGPPGNGKTKLARCLGKLLGSHDNHIILISGTELLSKWLGESEKNIAKLFAPAEMACSIFGNRAPLYTVIIDEIDIIAQERGTYGDCTGARAPRIL